MQHTPLLCIIQDYNLARKLNKAFIQTIENWEQLCEKQQNNDQKIMQMLQITKQDKIKIQSEIEQYKNSVFKKMKKNQKKSEKYKRLRLSQKDKKLENNILKFARMHKLIFEDFSQLSQFLQLKKYLDLTKQLKYIEKIILITYDDNKYKQTCKKIIKQNESLEIKFVIDLVKISNINMLENYTDYINKGQDSASTNQVLFLVGFPNIISMHNDKRYVKALANNIMNQFLLFCSNNKSILFVSQTKDEWKILQINEAKNLFDTNFDYTINLQRKDDPTQMHIMFENGYNDQKISIALPEFLQLLFHTLTILYYFFQFNKNIIMLNKGNIQMECLICYDKSKIKALTQCGHQALCIVCCFKKRTVSKNNQCLACTQESTKVIATDNINLQFDDKLCSDDLYFKAEIYAQNKQILSFCLALLDIQCSYQDCFQNFQNIKNYKQHLQEKHRRYLCDLCLKHSTLLITEQKLFRQQELYQHLQIGDKDLDGNLINKHPQCQSCQKYFFDEDQFLRHMHQEHYKCHICEKIPEKKFIFYKDYQQLDLHFQSFHYPCRDQNCIAAKFVVFNVQSSLQKHMQKVHNIQIKLQIFDDKQHEEDLGVDIRDQLISQIKNQKKEDRQIKDYTEFEQEFQRIQLFSILANIKETPIEEEKKIIYAFHHPQSDEGYKYKKLLEEIFFENVKFDLRQEDSINFEIFLNMVSDVLSESKKNFVRSSCIDFIKNQKEEYGLFMSFQNIFGPVLVYKYLYLYSLCCNLNSKKKLQNIISASLYQIPFKVTNILSISKTWEQIFCRATKNIQDTIFDLIKSRKIDLQKAIKVSSQRLYQLMREINKISLKDLIKLRYLNMFLCNQSSLQIIRQTFVCSLDHLQRNLQKINSQDLIISFLYFNTALYVFENRTQIKLPRSINPDILKLFIRHFPDLAAEIEFPIESEEEDYDLKTKNRKHSSKKQFDLTCFGKTKYMRKIFIFDKKQQGQNPIELDPDLDFPQLKSEQIDMQLQKRKVISKNIFKEFKNTEEDFPQLLSDNKVAKNNNKKDPKQSSQIKKTHNISQNVQNLPKKLGKEDFPSLGTYQNTDQELDSFQKLRKEQISVKKKHITQPQNCQFNKKQFPQLSQQSMTTPEENLMEKRLRNIEDMKFRGKKKQNYDKKFNLFNDNKLQQNLKKKNQKIVIYSDEEKQEVEQIINKQVQKIDLKDLKFGKNFNAQNSKLIKDKQNDVLIDKNIIQNTQVLKDEDFPSAFPDLETKDNSVNIFQRQNEKKDLKKIYDQRFNIRQQEKQINKEEDIKKKHKNKKKGKKVVLLQLQFQNKMFLKTLNLINNYTTKTSNLPFIFFRHIGQFLSSNQFAQELQYVQ